ncbi:MAG: pentapeptide repeat-containing protein [Clostridia bacterium]|nr:pentapeptide repeat-containing protein [Clostridia bacterium]
MKSTAAEALRAAILRAAILREATLRAATLRAATLRAATLRAAILRAQVRAMRGHFTGRPRTPPPTPLAGERRTASPYRSPRQRTAIPRPSPCLQTAIPRPSRALRLTQATRPRPVPRRIRAVHPAARIPILPSFTQGLRASSAHTE